MKNWRVIHAVVLFAVSSSYGQLANHPPVPRWLEAAPGTEGEVVLRTEFEHRGALLKAILLVAAESDTHVRVNEHDAAMVPAAPGKPALSMDVTSWIQQGRNTLSLRARKPRVAALLELNGDLAAKRWIASDAGWKCTPGDLRDAGPVDAIPDNNPFDLKKTFDAYNSWQLAKKGAQAEATDPAGFATPPGFKVERVRSAQADEDSWVAMTFDPQGRVIIAREKRGLLRLDPRQNTVALVEDSLLECRGLLFMDGVLYANANNSKGLYRMQDEDGDGRFEKKTELMRTEGGVGHGRNHIKAGPDGRIWLAHGNNVLLPSPLKASSPLQNYAWDQVLPNPWDSVMFDGNVELPAGHVLAYDPKDESVELVAGGLRNPLDLAFSRDGELFTFDADMERDVGAPWYMPTRVLHVVSGADFGWRRGTGRQAAWQVDTLPAVVDVGLASPTGVYFGHGARFPARYQEALYIMDWSYGRIVAVHLEASGASYTGRQETFVSGRPLNVTDGCVGPDGAMWFITGGRGTQSGLYRITYSGNEPLPELAPAVQSSPLRELRHRLEAMHGGIPPHERDSAFQIILPALEHSDRHIRWAARLALETLPASSWPASFWNTASPWRVILGSLALARTAGTTVAGQNFSRLPSLPWQDLSTEQRLALLRTLSVTLARAGDPAPEAQATLRTWLEPMYPATESALNHELCRLLIRLRSPGVLAKTLPLLHAATSSEDLVFYPVQLRQIQEGWTLDGRRTVFEALNRAETFNGASTYFKAIQDTRAEMAAALPPEQASQLAAVIHASKPATLSPHALPGHTYRAWKLEDFAEKLDQVGKGRSFEKGRAAAISSQCVFCHTMSTDRSLPAGLFGPELVQVSARFSRRDLLDHILNPGKVVDEKFRFTVITRTDGGQVAGTLESEDDERVVLKPNPLSPDVVEVGKSQIRSREISPNSPMPPGLLNALKLDQVLDLLAFIEAAGNPAAANFKP